VTKYTNTHHKVHVVSVHWPRTSPVCDEYDLDKHESDVVPKVACVRGATGGVSDGVTGGTGFGSGSSGTISGAISPCSDNFRCSRYIRVVNHDLQLRFLACFQSCLLFYLW
jgi:hypothetical protein